MRCIFVPTVPTTAFLLLILLAAGCAGGPPPAPEATETVALTVAHRTQRGALLIEGTTDLPDGAELTYTITHDAAATLPMTEWPAANLIESGRSVVQGGQYWARVTTTSWPAGRVRVLLQFPLPPQPAEVVARYGEFGEKLAGDNVISEGPINAVEAEYIFELRR